LKGWAEHQTPPLGILPMKTKVVIPKLGELLRSIITRAGYRSHIADIGLDKDLDDLAKESRDSSSCDLMIGIEDACREELKLECGIEWAQHFNQAWIQTRGEIQQLALNVDTSPLADEQGQEEALRLFVIPMLAEFLRCSKSIFSGPVADGWWKSPVSAWVRWTSTQAKVSNKFILNNLANHLDADPRSIDRWLAGEPLQKLHWPYRPVIEAVIGSDAAQCVKTEGIDQLTGWLIVSVAFQSLSEDERDRIRRVFYLRTQQSWSLENAVHELKRQGYENDNRTVRATTTPLLTQIEQMFFQSPDSGAIRQGLNELQALIDKETKFWRLSYQYIHDWFAARLAATTGEKAEALRLYEAAVNRAWWFVGPNQKPIITEALLYSVGVGEIAVAKRYWDKTFLLGLNNWPKRPLDEQERRRLAFGFEDMFAPQKAKDRIPPQMEVILKAGEYELDSQALGNTNRKIKHAEGRTRRTPLMDAIREGTLSDVKQLIAAGGDPNDFIQESGEGPLSFAMRRACDRKDPAIMEYLLSLDLLPETVNRQASTKRETPLKIAIEMADANAVERLICLGADVEAHCDYVPSALCYSMLLLHGSIHRNDHTQELAYMAGKGRADVYDAKDGAVLDADLANRRQAQVALRDNFSLNKPWWDAVSDYFIRPADNHRKVVKILLHYKANANHRYKVESHHLEEWTPTLFAAQVGDIEVFKALIEHGGDPDLTLMQSSSLDRLDALWVAVAYGRHAIVSYLTERLLQRKQ
jgi:ankyrin repeat protein